MVGYQARVEKHCVDGEFCSFYEACGEFLNLATPDYGQCA
jgi:hypothetical protein